MAAVEKGEDEAGGADDGEVLWLDADDVCDVRVCIVLPHDEAIESVPAPSIVYAPSSLISSIPYFQTCLTERWRKGRTDPRHEIVLPCAEATSPSDYLKCLGYRNSVVPEWMSVDEALGLLRAANHLVFEECEDYVMSYLASLPSSDEEDEIIQQTMSSIGIKPNGDLSAKLAVSVDVKVYKEVLDRLLQQDAITQSTLSDFVQATFIEAPEQVADVCASAIRDAWFKATDTMISRLFYKGWIVTTRLRLEHADTETLLSDFISVSKKLCSALHPNIDYSDFFEVLTQLLECTVPSKSNKRLVLLSNSQRAELVDAWMPLLGGPNLKSIECALRRIFMTLPLQDPAVVAIVRNNMLKPHFKAWFNWWRSKLFKRMNRSTLVHEETE